MRWRDEPVTWGQFAFVYILGSIVSGAVRGVGNAKGWW